MADETHRLIQDRLKKAEELRQRGIDPYPARYPKHDAAKEILEKQKKLTPDSRSGKKATIAGRLILYRRMGKIAFGQVQDATGRIQVLFKKDILGDAYDTLKKLDMGDIITVEGEVIATKTGEVTVEAASFTLLAKAIRPLPDKHHGLQDTELRYRKRYLDLMVNPEVKKTFRKRAAIFKEIRAFLDKEDFMEVHTPILQPLYGGGMARPFVTSIKAWDMTMYLRIAYEIYLKKLIVGGFERIYDLSSCFRNEGADKTHNPEFAMMEIQWAYADYNDAMTLIERLWEHVAKAVNGTTVIEYSGKKLDLKAPWKRLRVVDALQEFAGIDVAKLDDEALFALLDKHRIEKKGAATRGAAIALLFEELCEEKLTDPVHIIDYPIEVCPLAKEHRDDPAFAERVESYVNGWEVGNSYTELNDPVLQRKHFEEQVAQRKAGDDEAHPMDEDYLQALEHGLPPNAGVGIGIDRMVMLLTGAESIRDVILFPTMRPQ